MQKFYVYAAALILVFSLLIGCGGGTQTVNVQSLDSGIKQEGKSEKMNDLLLKSAMAKPADQNADYIIGADDLLEIDVFQAEELHKAVRVSSQGYISMALIGEVKAKGLTPVQLEQQLSKKLEKYMIEPRVSVSIKEYKAQKIGVIGSVKNPQMYMVTGQRYLLDMLTMAGGIAGDAGDFCYILRSADGEKPGTTKTDSFVINLEELLVKGDFSLNVPVFGGDVINVPKTGIVFVDGPVRRPGPFPFKLKMTLMEAIITAGGAKFEADQSDVKILRDKGDGTRELISVNYKDIADSKSNDIPVKENDIIVMGTNGVKDFLSHVLGFLSGSVSSSGGASISPAIPR
jgi:polysaccharide export outer membrane protein